MQPVSPYQKTQSLYWFARLVDKVRLKKTGRLPDAYFPNLGVGHDEQCLLFLGIKYPDLIAQIEQGFTDEELLAWAYQSGNRPTDLQVLYWNEYMRKRGWRGRRYTHRSAVLGREGTTRAEGTRRSRHVFRSV